MKKIITYLKDYFFELDKIIFLLSTVFIAVAIFINYHFHLNRFISLHEDPFQFFCWYFIFLLAFAFPYMLYIISGKYSLAVQRKFLFLLFIAPAIFAWKMVYDISFAFSVAPYQNYYWNQVIYWPFKLIVVSFLLFLIWKLTGEKQKFYGLSLENFRPEPYLLMLLIMVPLVAAASTQPDFLAIYPKLKNIAFLSEEKNHGLYKILYEISYGTDFFTIELFFRGFLVLAFTKWFGRDAVLPMALFYCTIHFGKPLGECISSYFGGLILGVVTYHTRTIIGGLMVHLGIAWMMEMGGYLGSVLVTSNQ